MVTEHLRDLPNFLAYTDRLLSFSFPEAAWNKTFRYAGLKIVKEIKTTSFITTFILEKHGAAT